MGTFLRKQGYLIEYTLSALLRHKGKNAALLLAYTLLVFLLASVMLLTDALRREAALTLRDSPEVLVQRLSAGRHALLPRHYVSQLQDIRGVAQVEPRLWGYFYDPVIKANYTLLASPTRALPAGSIVIGAGIARARTIEAGDYLSLRSASGQPTTLRVAEVLDSASALVSADLILLGEADLRRFFALPDGVYTDIALTVRNPREVRKVAEKITARLPDTRPILREEILRTYDAIFSWRQGMLFALLSVSVFAFIVLAWDKASGLSSEERREIGILKAIGWETSDVLHMKLWEGVCLSLTAFVLGYLLAYAHVFFQSAMLFEPVLKGWSVLYPRFALTPYVDGLQVFTLLFFTVVPYSAATLIPVWRASVADPDAVMR